MNLKNKKIGIWGLGVVGKAAVRYFYNLGNTIEVLDKRSLTSEEQLFLQTYNIKFYHQNMIHDFLQHNDLILVSPGVNLYYYLNYQDKFISELDLVAQTSQKNFIAITGSVGKTTVTHVLFNILKHYKPHIALGGNIGTCMLDVLKNQESSDIILELSSFQLERNSKFAPNLAIWTNFYPNHLDRHHTITNYFNAKSNIIAHQTSNQQALVSLSLSTMIKRLYNGPSFSFFSLKQPTATECTALRKHDKLFYINKNMIFVKHHKEVKPLLSIDQFPSFSFPENWLILSCALYLLDIPLTNFKKHTQKIDLLPYRLEKVATIRNINFYNDSKSTTPASTYAAIEALSQKPILLLLGGQSKGIDRTDLIKKIQNKVKTIYCFGCEHAELLKLCQTYAIPAYSFTTLEAAFKTCVQQALPGNQILFSPAGSSFDLFTDYKERGARFNYLVKQLIK